MPNWSGGILTTKGQSLQAKVDAGQTTLTITKMKIGSGVLPSGQNLQSLNDLVTPEMNVPISAVSANANVSTITGVITNAGLTNGFNVRELGVFAQDPTLGEILYSITTDSAPDYLPPEGGSVTVSSEFSYDIVVSNAASITATINQNGLVTASILENHNKDLHAHNLLAALHLWQPNHAYSVGDICYSSTGSSYKRFECVVAGVSGAAEPTWTAIGQLVADGTVKWIVDDIRDGVSIGNPIFDMIVRPGYLKCNGSLISRAAYPRLTKFAIDNGLIVSEALWGGGAFGVGDGSTTIRLPDFRGEFIRGWDDGRGIDLGRSIRSTQTDENKSHYHDQVGWTGPSLVKTSSINNNTAPLLTNGDGGVLYSNQNGVNTSNNTSRILATWSSGGLESRPHNIALFAVIKY